MQADILRARPDSICIEVTSKCNLRCSYCHKSDEVREALPASNADLTDDLIERLYRYCKEAGVRHVSLSAGGETTMSAGWQQRIAQFLEDPEIETHLVSNFARLFSEEDLAALTKIKNLQISFDSSELDMVRKLRSRADLRTITYNILRLRQKARSFGRSPNLVVNCTLWRENLGQIANLAAFCRELEVDQLLLTEGFVSTEHNLKVPETIDTLTDDDVVLFAKQIEAAEDVLSGSATALRLQDHLQLRIGDVLEEIRAGIVPADPAAYFHRRMMTSACRQPWSSPLVSADGQVWPCCVSGNTGSVGDLATTTMRDILDSEAIRAVRASILDGKPTLPCENCSFARAVDLKEFSLDIREWQGDTDLPRDENTLEAHQTFWPGLLGRSSYPVVVENSELRIVGQGTAALVESRLRGMHRLLLDLESGPQSEINFLARWGGRRRLRLDLADRDLKMLGRAQIVLTQSPKVNVTMAGVNCLVTPVQDRWFSIRAAVEPPGLFSHVNLTLMREDDAVIYAGDGRSGLELSGFQVA
jgi:molybdenum cofactor biosynthesis enzyme MoaA